MKNQEPWKRGAPVAAFVAAGAIVLYLIVTIVAWLGGAI